METKGAIRRDFLRARNEIDPDRRQEQDAAIRRRLLSKPRFIRAGRVLTYISFGSEVDTRILCEYCLSQGKEVCCPRVLDRGKMEFYPISSMEELEEGFRGILEPPMTHPVAKKGTFDDTVMLMPLVAFDKGGNRLGYGGGFYDRYLSDKPQLFTLALAYEEQCYPHELPAEDTDIRPKQIITPNRVIGNGSKLKQEQKTFDRSNRKEVTLC